MEGNGIASGTLASAATLLLALCAPAIAADRWATSVGYEPQHVIVDPGSSDAARIELQYPGRPQRLAASAPRAAVLNNVRIQLPAPPAAPSPILTSGPPGAAPTDNPGGTAAGEGTVTGDRTTVPEARGAVATACGTRDADTLVVCVGPGGAVSSVDQAWVRDFARGPLTVYTGDDATRRGAARLLDGIPAPGRDVVVLEDPTRVSPGQIRIERRPL